MIYHRRGDGRVKLSYNTLCEVGVPDFAIGEPKLVRTAMDAGRTKQEGSEILAIVGGCGRKRVGCS